MTLQTPAMPKISTDYWIACRKRNWRWPGEAVRNIRETAQLAQFERYNAWFDHTLLPIFKEYAQMTSSLLQIERDNGTIDVLFRNSGGLDITENCKGMYMALMIAVHIFMDSDAGDAVLALTYDCCRIVS